MLPLTQGHLTLFETCPRKYQLFYFDSLSGPSSYEQYDKTQWGSQFHLLMQQQALDLPVAALAAADTEMMASLKALEKAAPDVFAYLPISQAYTQSISAAAKDRGAFSQSEHRRRLAFNDYLLTVIYDLLVLSAPIEQGAQSRSTTGRIYDWKTHQKPPPKERLKDDWQTRLYLYVLCETTGLSAQQASMTYWFVRPNRQADGEPQSRKPQKPSAYTFDYSDQAHDQTRQALQLLTDRLTEMRVANYFPKVSIELGRCEQCLFNVRCDRAQSTGSLQQDPNRLLKAASQFTADTVEEVSL